MLLWYPLAKAIVSRKNSGYNELSKLIKECEAMDYVKFIGTAGARFVVIKQLRSSGGLWLSLQGLNILVDPGPGALVRCLSSRPKLDPETLDAVIVTHRHLDHANDVNVIVEAMTKGGFVKRGHLFAPEDALQEREPVLQSYLHNSLAGIHCLKEGGVYTLQGGEGQFSFTTPVRHHHPVETYGLKFNLPYGSLGLIADTAYFPELAQHYRCDFLILNVVVNQDYTRSRIYHLNFMQAKELIRQINPRAAIMTHFGMTMLKEKPWLLAEKAAQEMGIQVVAAWDGMLWKLPPLQD